MTGYSPWFLTVMSNVAVGGLVLVSMHVLLTLSQGLNQRDVVQHDAGDVLMVPPPPPLPFWSMTLSVGSPGFAG